MNKYEYIIFDMDDTLIDNLENVRYAFSKMLEYKGLTYNDQEFTRWLNLDKQFWNDFNAGLIKVPEEYRFPQELFVKYVQSLRYILFFNNEISIAEAMQINDLYLNSLKEIVVEIPGASKVLQTLSNKYTLVIATNGPKEAVFTKIDKIGCTSYIKQVFSADLTKNTVTKPNELYFIELLDYLNYHDKEKILIVGDSLKTDIQGGMNSNIDTCWFNLNRESLPSNYQPTYIINNLEELLNIL